MNHDRDSSDGNWSFSELRQIDALCDEFERAWNDGAHLAIEQLLAQNASLSRADLLDQLLRLELHLRRTAGDPPSFDQYQERFPADEKVVARVWHDFAGEVQSRDLPSTATDHQCLRSAAPRPDRIGRFLIRRFLGRGGFGAVYLAYDPDNGCEVALQIQHPERLESPRQLEEFVQEARTGEHLDHPHLVHTLSIEDVDGQLGIVQQFIDGQSLTDWYARTHPTPEQVVRLLIPVAQALGYLHEKGFVHRDLKPSNILVDHDDHAYVADFGLALHEAQQRNQNRRGELAGTFAYMAPEQIRRQTQLIDGQSDLWSFGVILYRLLTDRFPFGGPPPRNMADTSEYIRDLEFEIQEHDPRPLRQINPNVSRKLAQICLRCLEKRKRDRYQTGHDLAEDLRLILERSNSSIHEPSQDHELKIVPKGLRSFDAADAPFFLELLPGPRTLEGIPISVNFWRNRLSDTGGEGPIDVGVVYGPSGCGKSSFIKAGLVPLVGDEFVPLVIESTPEDTEVRLLKALRNVLPNLPQGASLIDACRWVSEHGAGNGRKVLLIFDQFEQWLHAHHSPAEHQFLTALRNCNGTRLQTLLLVRDDFWMPLTRFMEQLEIPLRENNNIAAVDLFDCDHARRVLLSLGRAYGRLAGSASELTAAQQQFLHGAVDGLAEDRRVICVRLALFAEMMKDRPWTPEELASVGGAKGIGVAFLEEKFGPRAPAVYRSHRSAVPKILEALLPPFGGNLKGQMRTVAELHEAAGSASASSFDQLLRILDTDLKLLTPVAPDQPSGEAGNVHPSTEPRYYQLTHDYLVPSVREWLTTDLRRTRGGQALLRLRERSDDWNRQSEPRRLPTWLEWVSIQHRVPRRTWTPRQRKMMRAASRLFVQRGATALVAIACVIAGAALLRRRFVADRERRAADYFVQRVRDAETPQVSRIRDESQPLSREVSQRLKQLLAQPDITRKDQLHAALILADSEPSQSEFLAQQVLIATPDEFEAIMSLPSVNRAPFIPRLWHVMEDASRPLGPRFRAGCALARWAPQDVRWSARWGDFAAMLVSESPVQIPQWAASFCRTMLIEPLRTEFLRHDEPDRAYVAAMVLSLFLRDQCADLVELTLSAQPRQLAIFASALKDHGEMACHSLESKLAAPPLESSGIEREALAKQQVNAALTLLLLGHTNKVWPVLRHSEDSRVRSYVIEWAASSGVPAELLTQRLHIESDPSIRQALILMLGEYGQDRLFATWRVTESAHLERDFRNDPDSGIHSAIEWLLRKWGTVEPMAAATHDQCGDFPLTREWCVNSEGQTLIILVIPANTKADARRVALSACKVSVEQFSRWAPRALQPDEATLPVNGVTLADAAGYCNWLSEKDGIPPEEWCYVEMGDPMWPIQLADSFITRKGYRLPTIREWNCACMAGAKTSRPYGDSDELLTSYAWYATNSNGYRRPIGLLKPNRFGLFDMLGDLAEMNHADETLPKEQQASIVYLGGMAFGQAAAPSAIDAERAVISNRNANHGFRVVRSLD